MAYELNLRTLLESGARKWEKAEEGNYYVLKDIIYCANPFEDAVYYINPHGFGFYHPEPGTPPDGITQSMWIYVTADIFEGKTINGYDAKTAPIIFLNGCGGWRSSNPSEPPEKDFVAMGCVFIRCGARSRGAGKQAGTGRDLGKSPCAVVDLKAGVRYLRLNDAVIPGDKNKVISVGTSGGGQMSSILGASGDMPVYYPYLYEIGAAGIEKQGEAYISTISDSIFAAQCYCPITDITNADAAYAWMRFDAGDAGLEMRGPGAHPGGHTPGGPAPDAPKANPMKPFSPFKLALQNDLAVKYAEYINSLGLKNQAGDLLTFNLGENGKPDPRSGSFYRQILTNISESLNVFLKDCILEDGSFGEIQKKRVNPWTPVPKERIPRKDAYDYLTANFENVENWLRQKEDGTFEVTDLAGFINGTHLKRNKDIPGFDTFYNRMESDAFGSEDTDMSHFSKIVADTLKENYDRYSQMEGFADEDVDAYIAQANDPYVIKQGRMMASMLTMLQEECTPAKHWRTRNGSFDEHTSFTIAYTLAMAANMHPGVESVDYGLVWMEPHTSAEGTASAGSFEEWVESICR